MQFEQVVRTRRSNRSFTQQPVSEADIQKLLAAAQNAPAAKGDHETTHITVVTDPETVSSIKAACVRRSSTSDTVRDPFYGAETLFFISATDVSDDHIEFANAGCIIENILLQATALGLGSVYIWGSLKRLRANEDALALLQLPQGYELLSAVAIGYPTEPLKEREVGERMSVTRI